jgi:hypothetical protein
LGQPCYAEFVAVPNYTYLKLKMPSPNGVITVGTSYKHAYECDMECVEYAEALVESETLVANLERLAKEMPDPNRHTGNFEPAEGVKLVPLDPILPDGKMLRVSATLNPNRRQCLSTSSMRVPWTCQASRGMLPSTP